MITQASMALKGLGYVSTIKKLWGSGTGVQTAFSGKRYREPGGEADGDVQEKPT